MLRKALRWLLRTVVVVVALLVIALLSEYIAHRVQPGSVLVVTFKGPVVERGSTNLLGILSSRETPLNVMRIALTKAAKDPRISGLAIKIIDTQMELSQAQEIADLIQRFRDSGKWTSAYVETAGEMSPGNLPYLVAAATGDISLMPEGELDLVGVGMREIFARGTLDWVGVRPNFASLGKFKSAANIFTEKDFTPAQREEDEALVGAMFDQIVGQTAKERNINVEQMRAVVDQAPLNAGLSLKTHMVERLEYDDQFTDRTKHHGGGTHRMVDFTDYVHPSMLSGFRSQDQIAVIYCNGEIVRGEAGFGPLLREAGKRPAFFRFPFNHTGDTQAKKDLIAAFLSQRGYRLATCTIDNSDYVFNHAYLLMIAKSDDAAAEKLRLAYLAYTDSEIKYYAALNKQVFGYEPPQVMLLHDNRLNSELIDQVLQLFEARHYKFVSLGEAQSDAAYQTPDTYITRYGPMWGYRWAKQRNVKVDGRLEPDPPQWIVDYAASTPQSSP